MLSEEVSCASPPPRPLDERSSEIWVHTFKPSDREGSGSD